MWTVKSRTEEIKKLFPFVKFLTLFKFIWPFGRIKTE